MKINTMKLLFELEPHEQVFLMALLENGGSYNLSPLDDNFRKQWKSEIANFNHEGLMEHINPEAGASWCIYALTKLGQKAATQYNFT